MKTAAHLSLIGEQAPALAPERPVTWPQRMERTLANGLRVVAVESHTIPKLNVQLLVRRGNAVAASEVPGLAEMTAAVLRTGTATRSETQIDDELRRMGADLACSAGADNTAISFSGLSEFSRELLELVADLAQHPSFPEAQFERERRQRLEELKIERTTPSFLASERLRRVLFGEHPYAIAAPTLAQVASYRREQLVEFHRRHFVPANALLIVVGDFVPERLFVEVEQAFSAWQGAASPEPEFAAPPANRGRHVHLVHLPGAVQAQVLVGHRSITRRHPDWFALTLCNAVLGGAFNSRLVMNIREQKGYTYSPRSAVHPLRQHGIFTVHAAVRNEVTAATLTEMFYEMDRMRALPVGAEELADAQNYLAGVFSLGLATQDGLAGQLATVYLNDLPPDYLETYRQKIRGVTAEEVLQVARRHLDSANAQIVVVGERAAVEEQAALFGPLSLYDANGNAL